MVHSQPPPAVINSMTNPHPAKKNKVGYIIVGVIELLVSISITVIGVVSWINFTQQIKDVALSINDIMLTNMPSKMAVTGVPASSSMAYYAQGFGNAMSQQVDSNAGDLPFLGDFAQDYGNAMPDQGSSIDQVFTGDVDNTLKKSVDAGSSAVYIIGIFTGVFFMITALMAFLSASRPSHCNIVAGMVLSIFSTIFAGCPFFSGTGVLLVSEIVQSDHRGLHIFSVCLSIIMFITSIVHSALCCAGSCCKGKQGTTVVSQQHTIQMYPGYPDVAIQPYYDNAGHIGNTPEYVDDRMNQKLIQG